MQTTAIKELDINQHKFRRLKKTIFMNYTNLIKGRQWYHQRFDGSPMFLFAVGEAETRIEKRKPKGTEANVRVSYFSRGKADWYLDMDDVNRGAKVIVNLAKRDPAVSSKLLWAWARDERAFEDFFWKEFPKVNLKKLSDADLVRFWQRYYRLFTKRFTSSSIIDHFALGTDELIGQMLRREIGGRISKESQFTRIFATATAPVKQSFINQAEIDLLKIALGLSKETLDDYQKCYFWLKNNYVNSQVLSVAHFRKEIAAWKKSGADLRAELRKIQETPKRNKRAKERLFRKHGLSPLLRALLKISEDFSWWQDERKKSTYLNIHIGMQILKEVARRTGYESEELKYAVAPEIPGILKSRHPARKELQERWRNSVFIMTRKGYEVRTGKATERIRKIMFKAVKYDNIRDIRGLSASLGRAIGKVKVLKSATEAGKIQKGDILVAVMTRPDYVTAMKKAGAIVTNEGGITSHAAIVSRELGIPCIIGTKIATEVFHDGDLVEVNANHGWVRKIQK